MAYHNWRHAFNTAQSMFALLKSGRLQVGAGADGRTERPPAVLSLFTSSLPTEQAERPGGPGPDDRHPEPRPGPPRGQQLLHPEVGRQTRGRPSPRVCCPLTRVCVSVCRSDHPLAQLYCHSTMEHHHFDHCLMILNSPVGAPSADSPGGWSRRRYDNPRGCHCDAADGRPVQ